MSKKNRDWKILFGEEINDCEYHYKIDSFFFFDNDQHQVESFEEKTYAFTFNFESAINNVVFFSSLKSIENLSILSEQPLKVLELIKKYENNLTEDQKVLFHDIRKEFVVPMEVDFISKSPANRVAFLGYSIFESKIEFYIKAFDYESIKVIFTSLIDTFSQLGSLNDTSFKEHIKWIRQKQLQVYKREKVHYKNSNKLLNGTINQSTTYSKFLKELKNNGFIDKDFRENLKKEITEPQYKHLLDILEKSYLLSVENGKINLLHRSEPVSVIEDDLKTVYTLNPRIWQYYINNWFEDYVTKAIKDLQADESFEIEILAYEGNAEYNFHETDKEEDKVEIDLMVLLKKQSLYKLVSVECKRTMSSRSKKGIKDKYKEKILKAPNNYKLIDAYINIGYFSKTEDIENKRIDSQNKSGHNESFPFLTFALTDYKQLLLKLKECFKIIMEFDTYESKVPESELKAVEIS